MHSKGEIFRDYLSDHFESLQRKNPNFSLRAFAKKLKMNPGALSLLLNGKRRFTDKMIERICDELCLSPTERRKIFSPYKDEKQAEILEQSLFESLSNWAHDAFLSLVQTKEFRNDPIWIANKLGVSQRELQKVIQNLMNLGLLKVDEGKYVPATPGTQVFVESNTTSALKKLQLDANALSRLALENEPVDRRYHGTNTLTVDPDKIDEAKAYIREFRNRFCTSNDWKGRRARVYQLNVSFYPIDQEGAQS